MSEGLLNTVFKWTQKEANAKREIDKLHEWEFFSFLSILCGVELHNLPLQKSLKTLEHQYECNKSAGNNRHPLLEKDRYVKF